MPWFLIVTGAFAFALSLVVYVLTVAASDERPSAWTKFGVFMGYWLGAWPVLYVLCRVAAWVWGLLWLALG